MHLLTYHVSPVLRNGLRQLFGDNDPLTLVSANDSATFWSYLTANQRDPDPRSAYDAVIINTVMHARRDKALEFIRKASTNAPGTPIVALVHTDGNSGSRAEYYKAGARDCLPIDISPEEVAALLEATQRLADSTREWIARIAESIPGLDNPTVTIDLLTLNVADGSALWGTKPFCLTHLQGAMLAWLMLRKGDTVTYAVLQRFVQSSEDATDITGPIKVAICRIRKALALAGCPAPEKLITTVWGYGYKLDPLYAKQAGTTTRAAEALACIENTYV